MTEISESINLDEKTLINTIYPEDKVEVIQENISDVPENQRIKLNDDTIYRFSCTVNDDLLQLKLSEIGAFAPYIYQKIINLDGLKEIHRMFNSCNNIIDAQQHINKLFEDKKIILTKEKDDFIILNITAYNISEIQIIRIETERKMTSDKDESLLKLYEIEKKEIKLMKKLKNYANKLGENGNLILNKIKEIENNLNLNN